MENVNVQLCHFPSIPTGFKLLQTKIEGKLPHFFLKPAWHCHQRPVKKKKQKATTQPKVSIAKQRAQWNRANEAQQHAENHTPRLSVGCAAQGKEQWLSVGSININHHLIEQKRKVAWPALDMLANSGWKSTSYSVFWSRDWNIPDKTGSDE